ncbi:EFR1 family ferrodoxin [Marispirochaeta sp.]|uniref:EFR1 family ferrodoxin n=1 Tax=Marispirochaeta sp. TaxID=2038653 RepID=UPI0029C9AE22|nr:EFR1 family ferrodoxin [Marispirochaeta sp.]
MKPKVYYFSATGNSLYVARQIVKNINGELIPIASQMNKNNIGINTDIVGIVFPVYYNRIPIIIEKFIKLLMQIEGKYLFAVCTYGGGPGESLQMIQQILIERGGKLSAAFGVHMNCAQLSRQFYRKFKVYSSLLFYSTLPTAAGSP